ncbi:glycoside hydrolase family 27 protein [Meridianimaribacter sp. CL38]|uniref:glycoside hydrolase family 27 protein n=1 Tax=Meridianimaribacter sp. CL38 TaxID=2213021 RepID=UPI00103BBE56|nr:glycoside hydrolase family 27 protein [Meridianimaribacter sp. CL38]TBV27829.1 glycoside hydrolase family 27 protein [Meridianimaribacter sp. CL38]
MIKNTLLALLFLISITSHAQKFEGLAETPPLGWNSWNTFGTDINEKLVMEIADKFEELGFKDAGYEYIVLDDGWMAKERDANGNLVADPVKFPRGMKALADYIHSKGLKFGLYNCAGYTTCAGYPGSRGYEYQDARSYASWDVDYLKYDWCNTPKLNAEGAYMTMRDALKAAGRPIVFSICEWGDNKPWEWAEDVGHLWRVTGDIINCWDCEVGHGSWSSSGVWKIINMRKNIRKAAGPGHWNDLDMMEVGNGMTDAEDRTHFAMWSMLASPLIMGNDLRTASKETIKTLTNKEVIAVNQDKLGIQGFRFSNENNIEIWIKPLDNDAWALTFVNMSDQPIQLDYDWEKHNIGDDLNGKYVDMKKTKFTIRDLFNHKDLGDTSKHLQSVIQSHDVLMVKLDKKN